MFSKLQKKVTLVFLGMALTHCGKEASFFSNLLKNDVYTQLYSTHDYDFLWVFDNSASMVDRRNYVKNNLQTFLNTLNSRKAINFQMAVTTTDYFTGAGALVQNGSGVNVVKSAQSSNPVAEMATIIDSVTDSPTSFWEQGLESAYQAVFNSRSLFSRTGVPLIILTLTDEEDYSCQSNCFGVEPEHNPNWIPFGISRYTNYFKSVKAAEGVDVNFFPLIGKSTSNCSVASIGTRYDDVAKSLDSSFSGSICLADIPAALEAVAQTLADKGIRFPLTNQASGQNIKVFVEGREVPYSADNGYVYEASSNSIVFTGNAIPTNGQTIEVSYLQAAK